MKTKRLTVLGVALGFLQFSCSSEAPPTTTEAPSTTPATPSKQGSTKTGLDGTTFERAQWQVRRELRSPKHSATALLTVLQGQQLKQDELADRAIGASWKEETDYDRRTLRRVLPTSTGEDGGRFRGIEYYRGRKPALTDQSAKEKAAKILGEVVRQEGTLGPGEEFRTESLRVKKFRSVSVETGQEENLVVGARVTLRRHLDSVPIVGPEGHASIVFDADGSLVELDFPTTAYVRGAALAMHDPGTVQLKNTFLKAGYASVPTSRGEIVNRDNRQVTVLDVQCGLRETESSNMLEKGCLVGSAEGVASPKLEFLTASE